MRNASFANLPKRKLANFTYLLTKLKFKRGQIVYSEGESTNAVFMVQKGEFELSRLLPNTSNFRKGFLRADEQFGRRPLNALAIRMPEVKDFPKRQRLNILEIGSLAGEEDCLERE